MTEYPEEVRPYQRRTARLRVEKMATQVAVNHQHRLCCGEGTYRKENEKRLHHIEPGQQRHAKQRHALATHAKGCGDEIDTYSDRSEARYDQRDRPIIGRVAAREGARRSWRVSPPSHIRRAACSLQSHAANKAVVEQQAAEGRHPEGESVQAWKGHIARAQHQRQKVVAETEGDRHRHEKNHRGAVHGENTIKGFRADEVIVRKEELDANDDRLDATDHKEEQGVQHVHDAQLLVINGDYPAVQYFQPGSFSFGGCHFGCAQASRYRYARSCHLLPRSPVKSYLLQGIQV